MGWVTPPTFTNGETSGLVAALNELSGDLVALNASPQIQSITTSPFLGTAPSINQPNFLLDINYQTQTTGSGGYATFGFGGGGFPNGVLIVLCTAGEAGVNGLVVNLQNSTITKTTFVAQCWYENGGNFVLCTNTSVVVAWIAVGF